MKRMQKTFFAFGTANTVSVIYKAETEGKVIKVLESIKSIMLQFDNMFSVFKKNSEISQINQSAGREMIKVSPETLSVIQKGIQFSQDSSRFFDITAGSLSRIWRKATAEKKLPEQKMLKKHGNLVNYKDIIVEGRKAGLSRVGQEIDLGGIAKGYGADEAKKILIQNEITNAIINFGGTILTIGEEKQIGIQNPDAKTGIPTGVVRIREQALVTSGLYERYFVQDGYCYHHIINPRTGMPSESGLISVSVVGDSAMEMDALATSVFIMGIQSGMPLLEKYHAEAIFIDEARNIFLTKGLEDRYINRTKEMTGYESKK